MSDQTTQPEAPLSLTPGERVIPSWNEPLVAAATRPIGGPLGEHAAVGRHWFWSPQRVGLLLACLALLLSWFGKASCIQEYTDDSGTRQLDWRAGRPFVAMCYSDIIPLYSSERLNDHDTFPYVTSWTEDEGTAKETTRYMEYPVATGYSSGSTRSSPKRGFRSRKRAGCPARSRSPSTSTSRRSGSRWPGSSPYGRPADR